MNATEKSWTQFNNVSMQLVTDETADSEASIVNFKIRNLQKFEPIVSCFLGTQEAK